jgi:hypothetical protein
LRASIASITLSFGTSEERLSIPHLRRPLRPQSTISRRQPRPKLYGASVSSMPYVATGWRSHPSPRVKTPTRSLNHGAPSWEGKTLQAFCVLANEVHCEGVAFTSSRFTGREVAIRRSPTAPQDRPERQQIQLSIAPTN